MRPNEIVVIGASAGGIEALTRLLPFLPSSSPDAYFIVIHVGQGGPGALPQVLARVTTMPVAYAVDGDAVKSGGITVAPPGTHTVLTRRSVRLLTGPRENGHRPAVDTLFRSAAAAWGERVTGVILSGSLDDGAAGLAAIAAAGGLAFVQEPDEALYPSMPLNAIARVAVDKVLAADELGRILAERAMTQTNDGTDLEEAMRVASDREATPGEMSGGAGGGGAETAELLNEIGANTDLTCPACGGAIWEIQTDGVPVLRCHVGHAYGLESFDFEQTVALESALWTALRALEEKQILLSRLGEQSREEGRERSATAFLTKADGIQRQADALRELVESVMTAESGSGGERRVPA